MKKIFIATITLVCLSQETIYATASIDELIKEFKKSSNIPFIAQELQNRNISVTDFVRLAAEQRVQRALQIFQVSCILNPCDMQKIESSLSAPEETGILRYNTPKELQEILPALKQIVARNRSLLRGSCTVYYGRDTNIQTVARPQTDGSYKHELWLPASFTDQSPEEQDAILRHEFAHIGQRHNERIHRLQMHNLELFSLYALPSFQNNTSLGKAINSDELRMVHKAQELEADSLALLHENPRSIQIGMEQLLKNEAPDPNHPSKEKRLAWARKIVALLEAEKQLSFKALPA